MKIGNIKIEKIFIIIGFSLFLLYFISRLTNLTLIPVFVDEAIYIRWAQVMRAVSSLRFLPLSDGKQPLFMWLVIPALKLISDPLFAGRTISVLAGFGTMAGVFVLSLLLFRKKEIALFASILYLISPFALFFDRMALADGLLSFFFIWSFIFLILLVKNPRLDLAMISGILLGSGMLTKSPALFMAILLPTTSILFKKNVFKLILFWLVVYLFGFAIYNILRLGPEFHMIAIRNKDYVFSFSEVLKHPWNPFMGNFKSVIFWFWTMLTPLTFLSVVMGLFLAFKRYSKETILLLIWIFVPLFGQSAIAKVYTARYILFTVPIILIFAAYFTSDLFTRLKNKWLTVFFLVVLFIWPIYQSFLFLTNPQNASLPENERSGYLEMWTSGYGIKETADYLQKIAKNEKVLVGTEGYFGTLPDGLQIYLEKIPNITVIGVGYPIKEISSKLTDGLKDNRVFLLVNDSRLEMQDQSKLKLIASYPKSVSPSGNRENLLFFEIVK